MKLIFFIKLTGKGEKSSIISATTDGRKPIKISKEEFLLPNTTFVLLFLDKWLNNSCPITYFELNYRRKDETNWTLVSNSLIKQKYYTLGNLQPGTEYVINVKAHNNAGSIETEYKFYTLQNIGGKNCKSFSIKNFILYYIVYCITFSCFTKFDSA